MPVTIDTITTDVLEGGPTSFILMLGSSVGIIPFRPTDAQEKQLMLAAARHVVARTKPDEVWFVFEAWMVNTTSDGETSAEEERAKLPRDLADAPGRIEVLVCQHESRATGRKTWFFDIVRDKAGKITELVDRSKRKPRPFEMVCNMWIMLEPKPAGAVH